MKGFFKYKRFAAKEFKRMVVSGGDLFEPYKPLAMSFLNYADTTLVDKIDEGITAYPVIATFELSSVVPSAYKHMFTYKSFQSKIDTLQYARSNISMFDGKEDILRVFLAVNFIEFVLTCKLVEFYVTGTAEYNRFNNYSDYKVNFKEIGMGIRTFKYLDVFKTYDSMSVDEWVTKLSNIEPSRVKMITLTTKRVLNIILGSSQGV